MVEPSPCPRCGSTRQWQPATDVIGPVQRVACLGCDRLAEACVDCGWEYRGAGRTCASCILVAGHPQPPVDAERKIAALSVFHAQDGVSDDDLRRADEADAAMLGRYAGLRVFRSAVEEAHQRAAALARLEAQLRELDPSRDAA